MTLLANIFIIALLLTMAAFILILLSEAVRGMLHRTPDKLTNHIIQVKRDIVKQIEGATRQES